MFGSEKRNKNGASKKSCAVSFIGEEDLSGFDRDLLVLRLNAQIINIWNAYESVEFYLAGEGEFDKIVLKVLNFYRDNNGNIHNSKCYIVTPELKLVDYDNADPFDNAVLTDESLEKIRNFLTDNKILISYVGSRESKLGKYLERSVMQGNPTLNLCLEHDE